MQQTTYLDFHNKLFAEDRKGREILLNTKDYVYRDTKTGEEFGALVPTTKGWNYFIYDNQGIK